MGLFRQPTTYPTTLHAHGPFEFFLRQNSMSPSLWSKSMTAAGRALFWYFAQPHDDCRRAKSNGMLGRRETSFGVVPFADLCVSEPIGEFPRAVKQCFKQVSALLIGRSWQSNSADVIRPSLHISAFWLFVLASPRYNGMRCVCEGEQCLARQRTRLIGNQ